MFLRSSTVWTRDKRTILDITFDAMGKLMHAVPHSRFDYQIRPPKKESPSTRPAGPPESNVNIIVFTCSVIPSI